MAKLYESEQFKGKDLAAIITNPATDEKTRQEAIAARQEKEADMKAAGTWQNDWQTTSDLYQPAKNSGSSGGIVSTSSAGSAGTASPVSSAAPAKGTTQNGRYYTTIKDALGNTYDGYIDTATGKSYHSNGRALDVGERVQAIGGDWYFMSPNGGVAYDPGDSYQNSIMAEIQAKEIARQQTEQQIADIEAQLPALNRQYDELARGNWVNYRLGERDLDQQLAAAGYTGGLAESSKTGLYGNYMTNYAEGETARSQAIDEINRQIASARADGNTAALEITLQYGQMIADALAQKRAEQAQAEATAWERKWQEAQIAAQYGNFGPLGDLIDGLDVEGLTEAWKAQNTPQYTSSRSSGGGTGSSSGSSDKSGVTQDYTGLFEAALASGHAKSFIANNYKRYGFSSSSGLYDDYEAWAQENENNSTLPIWEQVTNKTKHHGIEGGEMISVGGRWMTFDELYELVLSGKVAESFDPATGKYTYTAR